MANEFSMEPVQGAVDVDIPVDVLWELFSRPRLWSRWNPCFFWALNQNLVLGKQLIWVFQPLKWWYGYKLPAIARIVELVPEGPARKVTWEVTALPGFFARHSYSLEDLGEGRTRFSSHEVARGWSFELLRRFWLAHFRFVKDRSLEGAQALEPLYREQGRLDETTVKAGHPVARALKWGFALLVIAALALGTWFYTSFVRQQTLELAPGVHAVLGGGGNALVVEGPASALLVDTKFPPGAGQLQEWIAEHVQAPLSHVINTHYHYDHVLGNHLYPGASILAHRSVPSLLRRYEPEQLREYPAGIPNVEIGDAPARLELAGREVVLIHPEAAHTSGDLVVYLPREKILATGDLFFFTYYPFFDLGDGGADLDGLIRVARRLAAEYPDAVVVPGHGPLARAADLSHYADYLEFLRGYAEACHRRGWTEDQAAESFDPSTWGLSILPSFHHHQLTWATAASNARDAYRLVQKGRRVGATP